MRENNIEKIWPRWKVDSVLGKGSFGTVYKVVRKTFDQTFYAAVKCIHIPEDESQIREMQSDGLSRQEVSDYYKEAIQGLAGEISIMESLKGASNIVSIEDYEIEPDEKGIGWNIYIRMELLENLNTFRQHNDMSPAQTVQMGIDICTALEYCSRKNIIHRDIKPDNIFVSQFGQFKLGDFGIARHLEGTRATMSQKGTSTYMAPEIFRGERYDATVDTYSLGLVLYRLVNGGRMPFMPPSPAPIRYADMEAATNQRLSGCVLPPPSGCDSQLAEIVCRAAHPDPAMRYKGPTDMKADLLQWLAMQTETPVNIPADVPSDTPVNPPVDTFDFERKAPDQSQQEPPEHTIMMFRQDHVSRVPKNVLRQEPDPAFDPYRAAPSGIAREIPLQNRPHSAEDEGKAREVVQGGMSQNGKNIKRKSDRRSFVFSLLACVVSVITLILMAGLNLLWM